MHGYTINHFKAEMVTLALFWPLWTLALTLTMMEWRSPGIRVTLMSIALVTRAVWMWRLWNLPVGVSITRTIFLSSVHSFTSCLLWFYFFHYFCLNVHSLICLQCISTSINDLILDLILLFRWIHLLVYEMHMLPHLTGTCISNLMNIISPSYPVWI